MRGEIYSPEAYARGKMLNHSGWAGMLPRNITPSDWDAALSDGGDWEAVPIVFDDDPPNKLLLVEFSSRTPHWEELRRGQLTLYKNTVKIGGGRITAALALHAPPEPGVQIDTARDVLYFSVLRFEKGSLTLAGPYEGCRWTEFVVGWYQAREFL